MKKAFAALLYSATALACIGLAQPAAAQTPGPGGNYGGNAGFGGYGGDTISAFPTSLSDGGTLTCQDAWVAGPGAGGGIDTTCGVEYFKNYTDCVNNAVPDVNKDIAARAIVDGNAHNTVVTNPATPSICGTPVGDGGGGSGIYKCKLNLIITSNGPLTGAESVNEYTAQIALSQNGMNIPPQQVVNFYTECFNGTCHAYRDGTGPLTCLDAQALEASTVLNQEVLPEVQPGCPAGQQIPFDDPSNLCTGFPTN